MKLISIYGENIHDNVGRVRIATVKETLVPETILAAIRAGWYDITTMAAN